MRIIAVGSRTFVSGFQLAGIYGQEVKSSEEAWKNITTLSGQKDVGLIILSDDVASPIRDKLTAIRSKQPVPLIYEAPSPGSKQEKMAYKDMLKQILGV